LPPLETAAPQGARKTLTLTGGVLDRASHRRYTLAPPSAFVPFDGDFERDPMAPGQVLNNRYEIIRLVGRGGMGSVYQGYDNVLFQTVALKSLLPILLRNEKAVLRFEREAQILMDASHQNVVKGLALVQGTVPVLVMEFLRGPTLSAIMEHAQLPVRLALGLGIDVCSALDYLEKRGIYRLDLKPSNVIVDGVRGGVLIDLGIAKGASSEYAEITNELVPIGTPMYMAPEQFRGNVGGSQVDIYSFGVMLYEMIEGRLPWTVEDHSNIGMIGFAKMHQDIELWSHRMPEDLRRLIAKATQRDPARRYQNAQEMLEELMAIREAQEPGSDVDTMQSLVEEVIRAPTKGVVDGDATEEVRMHS
jgi:serine/threonine protein kinase